MYSSSRVWISPKVRAARANHGPGPNQGKASLEASRRKLCPNSPFWGPEFNVENHQKEWEEGRRRMAKEKMEREEKVREEKQRLQGTENPATTEVRTPFGEKDLETHHSAVLCQETVFTPSFEKGRENVAGWPSKTEMKYEGDDRISTDRLHGRFLGAPRVAGNETVNWQHRAIIPQYPCDDFYYPVPNSVDIFMRTHRVDELEFTDEEGEEAIGKELMDLLDPKDQ